MKLHLLLAAGLLAAAAFFCSPLRAQETIECTSVNRAYNECRAPWVLPEMIKQTSRTQCVKDVNYGTHPNQRLVWVSEGCSGVFADAQKKSTSNSKATKAAVIGVAAGAVLGAVLMNQHDKKKEREARKQEQGYTGCHGTGCLVDDPDAKGYRPYGNSESDAGYRPYGNSGSDAGYRPYDNSDSDAGYRPYGDSTSDDSHGYRPYGNGSGAEDDAPAQGQDNSGGYRPYSDSDDQ